MPASSLTLDRIRGLLEALDRPDTRYPSILVAGTKGKGSTAAMTERALRAAGYRTGLYTQPHLHTIRERIRIEGVEIAPGDFVEGLDAVRAAGAGDFTAYEIVTALALERFAAHAVDVAVLEVGLGGRLDATNAVDATVSVLTSISLDHTQILGHTIEAIAREKADIVKIGRPSISAPQADEALAIIRDFARRRQSELLVAGDNGARWEPGPHGTWDLATQRGRLADVRLALRGGFQRTNAAVAATVLDALQAEGIFQVPLEAVRRGLEDVIWPGRLECVRGDPLVVLDGAHNVDSATRLREALGEEYPGLAPVYVLGIAADKDILGITRALCGPATDPALAPQPWFVVATAAQHPRAAPVDTVAAAVQAVGPEVCSVSGVAQALSLARAEAAMSSHASRPTTMPLSLARAEAAPRSIVVATGSLQVVAEAREALGLAAASWERAFDPWAAPWPG